MIFPGSGENKEEDRQLALELKVLEAIEIYSPSKLKGVHGHFVFFGLMDNLERRVCRSDGQSFTREEVLALMDRFYNLEKVKQDEEDEDLFAEDIEFSLPEGFTAN